MHIENIADHPICHVNGIKILYSPADCQIPDLIMNKTIKNGRNTWKPASFTCAYIGIKIARTIKRI